MLSAIDFSNPVTISLILTGVVAAGAYAVFFVVPAWASYGRAWERVAASFLTLFILAAMIGLGTALGGGIVWFYRAYTQGFGPRIPLVNTQPATGAGSLDALADVSAAVES